MKNQRLLAMTAIIVITAFIVGCAEQDAVDDNDEDQSALQDDEVAESIDEDELNDKKDETEISEDLSETEVLEDNDVPEAEEFSSSANPLQVFNQARENSIPIVLKFYSDT